MLKLTNGFDRLTHDQLIAKSESVETMLTNNATFTGVNPTVPTLNGLNKEYRESISAASSGDKTLRARRDANRLKVIDLLRLMANSVTAIALGDREKLISSGFDLAKIPQSRPLLIKPAPPTLTGTGNSGQIKSVAQRQPAMISMIHQIAEYPFTATSSWTGATTSSAKHVFEHCTPGKTYLVRVCIVGSNKQCVESEPVGYIAQ